MFYFIILFFLYFFYKHVTLSHSPWKNHSSISQYYKVVFCWQFTYFDFILWLTWFASLINWNIKNFHLEILCNLHNSRIIQDFWRIIRQKIVHNLLEKKCMILEAPWLDLPLTVIETFWLLVVPAVLFATHLYVKLPLFITTLLNSPERLLPNRTSFSKKWYIAGGFASAAEQLKNTTSFRHALLAETFVVNCTSSGLTEKRRDRHRDTLISKELTKFNNTQLMNEADYNKYFCINFIRNEFFFIYYVDQVGWLFICKTRKLMWITYPGDLFNHFLFVCFLLIFIFEQHIHVNHLQDGPKPMSDCSGQEEI